MSSSKCGSYYLILPENKYSSYVLLHFNIVYILSTCNWPIIFLVCWSFKICLESVISTVQKRFHLNLRKVFQPCLAVIKRFGRETSITACFKKNVSVQQVGTTKLSLER